MKKIILSLFLIFFVKIVEAQNVTILPSGITPVKTSYLKLTFEQIQAKTDMTVGDLIYDTSFYCLRMYNGHEWLRLLNSQSSDGEATAFGFNSVATTISGIAHDSQNNIYITGYFLTSLVLSPTVTLTGNSVSENLFIAKFNAEGTLLAYTKEVGSSVVIPYDLYIDGNDNVYVAGSYKGTVTMGGLYNFTSNSTTYDAFVSKYNTSLAIQWSKSEGGVGDEFASEIASDASGNIFIGGYFTETINFNGGAVQKTSVGSYDVFIAKYTSTGTLTWANSFGGLNSDVVNDIHFDGINDLYLTGYYDLATTIGSDSYTSNGETDFYIAKFDKDGVYQASFSGGGTGADYGNTIVQDSQGWIFVGGDFHNTITIDGLDYVSKGGSDMFLVNLSKPYVENARVNTTISLGIFETFGSDDPTVDDFLTETTNDADGNIYVTGFTSGTLPIDGFSTTVHNGVFLWKRHADVLTIGLYSYPLNTYPYITRDNIGNVFLSGGIDVSTTIGGAFINIPSGTMSNVLMRVRLN
ncbi:hypothetical protein EMA8858_01837 [Emticicia aquatica]|uniref:Beta-propeller repeat-containing protein n=1 Tax=Emticicia aquatica TaxID=1681835 RepID=A0ABN8ES23_9BACT|nr:SBBP repeat-containing protein [Emticicia aquatica]CAH0995712.1 hypothetical protein EMA8858_01837 [Emticicia aquatica]